MTPYVDAHIKSIIEGIRLLESFVTAPLGLHSDIKMLREALHFPEAADLPREQVRERRTALSSLTETPLELTLAAIATISSSIDAIVATKRPTEPIFSETWIAQSRRVLARAEHKVGADMRVEACKKVHGLCVIIDPESNNNRPIIELAEAVLKGGANILQVRDKVNSGATNLKTAMDLKAICADYQSLLITSKNPSTARLAGAHGLHIGQNDMPVPETRKILYPNQLVGCSTSSMDEVMESQGLGVDYVMIETGLPISNRNTEKHPSPSVELIEKTKAVIAQPIIAVGSISESNASLIVQAGADGICVEDTVTLSDDPEIAARRLIDIINNNASKS